MNEEVEMFIREHFHPEDCEIVFQYPNTNELICRAEVFLIPEFIIEEAIQQVLGLKARLPDEIENCILKSWGHEGNCLWLEISNEFQ